MEPEPFGSDDTQRVRTLLTLDGLRDLVVVRQHDAAHGLVTRHQRDPGDALVRMRLPNPCRDLPALQRLEGQTHRAIAFGKRPRPPQIGHGIPGAGPDLERGHVDGVSLDIDEHAVDPFTTVYLLRVPHLPVHHHRHLTSCPIPPHAQILPDAGFV